LFHGLEAVGIGHAHAAKHAARGENEASLKPYLRHSSFTEILASSSSESR
jgi:hypothetical protein